MKKKDILPELFKNIKKGKNSLLWKKNVSSLLTEVNETYLTVYLDELAPVKSRLVKLIIAIHTQRKRKVPKETELSRKTTEDLKQMLFRKASGIKVVIVFNHFEHLTPSTARFWLDVSKHKRIVFLGSLFGRFRKEAYSFYKTFDVINKSKMEEQRPGGEMDITIPFLLICGAIIFVSFLKISIVSSNALISAIWFSLLLTRTLLYVIGR